MVSIEMDGRITFTIHRPEARKVELVGAFDGWHEQRIAMRPAGDGWWRVEIDPGPGEYLFRYLMDGKHWLLDESAHGDFLAGDGSEKSRVWRPPLRLDPDTLAA